MRESLKREQYTKYREATQRVKADSLDVEDHFQFFLSLHDSSLSWHEPWRCVDGESAIAGELIVALMRAKQLEDEELPGILERLLRMRHLDPSGRTEYYVAAALGPVERAVEPLGAAHAKGWGPASHLLANRLREVENDGARAGHVLFTALSRPGKRYPLLWSELGICYAKGIGVPKSLREAKRLYEKATRAGDPVARRKLAVYHRKGFGTPVDLAKAAALLRSSLFRRDDHSWELSGLREMLREDPAAVVPYGDWEPSSLIHEFVPRSMHLVMKALLLCHARKGSVVAQLPHQIVTTICGWVCTKPLRWEVPVELARHGETLRKMHALEKRMGGMEAKLDAILRLLEGK